MRKLAFIVLVPMVTIGILRSAFAFDTQQHHTHLTAELKPIPDSFQIARATFLPDRYYDLGLSDYDTLGDDFNFSNCDEFTLSSCPEGSLCLACPFNHSKYLILSCRDPYFSSNGKCVCPPPVPLNNTNDKCTKYCANSCVQKSCTPSVDQTNCTKGTEICDNGCGKKSRLCCRVCEHAVLNKPANSSYIYATCSDGTGVHEIQADWQCNDGYHKKGENCQKDCIANPCSGFGLTSCPSGYVCEKCTKTATDCSTDGDYFKIIECPSGQLDWNNYWCGGALKCWLNASHI